MSHNPDSQILLMQAVDWNFGREGALTVVCWGAIAFKSETQTTTASSSTEAEPIAAFAAAKAAHNSNLSFTDLNSNKWIQWKSTQTTRLHFKSSNDNQAPTVWTRHLDIGFFSLQDWTEEELIAMVHIVRVLSLSDDLTRPLACCLHALHCGRMMGHFN